MTERADRERRVHERTPTRLEMKFTSMDPEVLRRIRANGTVMDLSRSGVRFLTASRYSVGKTVHFMIRGLRFGCYRGSLVVVREQRVGDYREVAGRFVQFERLWGSQWARVDE